MRILGSVGRLTMAAFFLLVSNASVAFDSHGYLAVDAKYFFSEPLLTGQEEHAYSASAYWEGYKDFDQGEQRLAITAFVRVDGVDDERNHVDLREAYWWKQHSGFETYVGLRKVFWGVTESVHLVDVINQTDALENIDGEDKLGQPMLQMVKAGDFGTVQVFWMPWFRERQYLGNESRLRPSLAISDQARYQSSSEQNHHDFALRWSHYLGPIDIGVSHFSGTNRSPSFEHVLLQGEQVLQPYYYLIEQSGIDLQATLGSWLLKSEIISVKERDAGRHFAAAAGIEYTFFTILGNSDLGIVAEYAVDDRPVNRRGSAQNDLSVGVRWAFNDLDGSEILALLSHDFDYEQQFASIEMNRRLSDDWRLEFEARQFINTGEGAPEYDLRDDGYVQVELRRYF
jgi:hypothetical protein